ncbi:hypothetical protein EV144_101139 [Flavobacterium sp. 270]|uniref:hypothetical protein n=1 Tax=Flavobacterium sp. 270 TaxID=2512114 RepID=UPI001065C957|nr:hypothetical protein [Flavobacterium sp. 270]TDW51464.1 hypothetical protein EV144_101139 [Flavobacterium sp. 270]
MNLKFLLPILLIFVLVVSCNSNNSKEDKKVYKPVFYRAVNGKDTAILALNINDKRFYGRYEILYHRIGKDSGDVRGDLRGDTLRGDYHYISNGGSWKRIPLALLKKDNNLYLGKGVIGTIFNLPCFVPEVPIEYNNSDFIFEEVKE